MSISLTVCSTRHLNFDQVANVTELNNLFAILNVRTDIIWRNSSTFLTS